MNSDTQLKVQSYLDNELSPSEARKVAGIISADREARELYNELKATKEILAQNEPAIKLDESREFYWSKIQRQIEAAERTPQTRPTAWWVRLLAPLAGTAALFAALLSVMNPETPVANRSTTEALAIGPLHGEVEDLTPEMSSVTFRSEADGVTVVWLSSNQ